MIVRSIAPSIDYDELDLAVLDHLAKLLGLREARSDVSIVFDFFAAENTLEPIVRWQRDSFLERYAAKAGLDLNVLLGKMVRDSQVTPFDSSLLGAFA